MEEQSTTDKVKKLASKGIVQDIIFLDKMLTPKIMTFVYWLLLLGTFISGIVSIVYGNILSAIFIILFGGVFVRISCEISLVFFRMNEALQEMRKK